MKFLPSLLAACLILSGCGVRPHKVKHQTHKQKVHVHKTVDKKYLYHDIDTDTWFELMEAIVNSDSAARPYDGNLSTYRSAGASWKPVNAKEIPEEVREEIIEQDAQVEVQGNETTENIDAASVETIEVDVAENGVPVDPSVDLGSDGTYETVDTSSDSSSSFDSGSSDSSSSNDFGGSDSSSSSPD